MADSRGFVCKIRTMRHMLSQLSALLAVGLAVAPAAGWWMPPTLAPSLRPAHCAGTRVALSKCLAGGGRGAEGCPQPDCCDSLSLEDLRASVQTLAIDLAQQYSDDEAQIETTDARGLAPHELARERLLCARLSGLELARTRISSLGAVAGRGVFATRDIQKGELITCYPGDALIALAGPSRPWGKEDEGDDVIFGLHVPPGAALHRLRCRWTNDTPLNRYVACRARRAGSVLRRIGGLWHSRGRDLCSNRNAAAGVRRCLRGQSLVCSLGTYTKSVLPCSQLTAVSNASGTLYQ